MMLDAIRSALAPHDARRMLLAAFVGAAVECVGCATTNDRSSPMSVARPVVLSREPVASTLGVDADVEEVGTQRNEPPKRPLPRVEPKTSPFPPTLGPERLIVDSEDEP